MGLSISWHLALPGSLPLEEVRNPVESLREYCRTFPFERVSDLRFLDHSSLQKLRRDPKTIHVWGDHSFPVRADDDGRLHPIEECRPPYHVITAEALEIVSFVMRPGPGCETADFGVARIPDVTSWVDPDRPDLGAQTVPVPRHNGRWYGFGGAKTQYAALPEAGGISNFLRCHLGLVAILDRARELGFEVDVHDAGAYWKERDPQLLLSHLHRWNQTVAGIVGKFKDLLENRTEGVLGIPMTGHPDFEHLEAGGGSPGRIDLNDPVVVDFLRRTGARGDFRASDKDWAPPPT